MAGDKDLPEQDDALRSKRDMMRVPLRSPDGDEATLAANTTAALAGTFFPTINADEIIVVAKPTLRERSLGGIRVGPASADPASAETENGLSISSEQAFARIAAAINVTATQLTHNIEQARQQQALFFKLTLGFASLGFLVVLVGVVLGFLGQVSAGVVSVLAGIIPEATAVIFFQMDKELRRRIEGHNAELRKSQQLHTMIDVAETIEDAAEKDRMKQLIIAKSLGIEPAAIDPDTAAADST